MSNPKRLMLVLLILLLSACTNFEEGTRYRKQQELQAKKAFIEKRDCTFGHEDGMRDAIINNIIFKDEIRNDIRACIRELPPQEDSDDAKEAIETCEEMSYQLNGGVRPVDTTWNSNINLIREIRNNIDQCADVEKKLNMKHDKL